jgi:hypothetical protein
MQKRLAEPVGFHLSTDVCKIARDVVWFQKRVVYLNGIAPKHRLGCEPIGHNPMLTRLAFF